MSLGLGIFLLVVGGILAFGVQDRWDTLDLTAIGYICMAAGLLAIILTMVMQNQRRRTTAHVVQERYDNPPGVQPPRAP